MNGSISIVIPNLHSPIIDQVIAALTVQTAPAQEIIVVGQDRYGLVPADVIFLQTERPISAAAARNLGARHAGGDYVLFIDSDCIACPQLIERLKTCHACGMHIIGGGVAPESDCYWTYCDNLLVFADVLHTAVAGERALLPSLNLSMPGAMFLELGGFDERYPGAAGEDLDLSLRLRAAGQHLYFEPHAWVAHQHQRADARSVWEHLRSFGRAHVRVQQEHAAMMPSVLHYLSKPWAPALRVAAPFLAALDIMRLYALIGYRLSARAYYAAPGMVWAKTGWYWGVADALSAK